MNTPPRCSDRVWGPSSEGATWWMPNGSTHLRKPELSLLPHRRYLRREVASDGTSTRFNARGNRPTFDPGTLFPEALREPQYALAAHAEGAA